MMKKHNHSETAVPFLYQCIQIYSRDEVAMLPKNTIKTPVKKLISSIIASNACRSIL